MDACRGRPYGAIFAPILFAIAALGPSRAEAQADMEAARGAPGPDLVARALGVDASRAPALDEAQLDHAREIGRDVVCLCGTCPKEPIADCQCGWASLNRRTIQQAVAKGMSREDIVATYRQQYGDRVLAMLPNEGFARAAWILPYAAAVLMLGGFIAIGTRFLRRAPADPAPTQAAPGAETPAAGSAAAKDELARELDELD